MRTCDSLIAARASAPGRRTLLLLLALCGLMRWADSNLRAGEALPLGEPELQTRLLGMQAANNDAQRLEAARALVNVRAVSSLQVKALAQTIQNEDARLEFAVHAFPHTVDPENFYEVYDAFQSYSKVFRLHDRVRPPAGRPGPPVAVLPPALTPEEFSRLLQTVRAEAFDNTRLATARQMVTSAAGRISSPQVRELLRTFTFEDGRLALAREAYRCVLDPWNYSVVYDAFTFPSSREALARHIQAKESAAPPPR